MRTCDGDGLHLIGVERQFSVEASMFYRLERILSKFTNISPLSSFDRTVVSRILLFCWGVRRPTMGPPRKRIGHGH